MATQSMLREKHCTPCEGGTPPLSEADENRLQVDVPNWDVARDGEHRLVRSMKFDSFGTMATLLQCVADIVDQENHHPDIHISGTSARFELSTHKIGGLSENDFIMASKIDSCINESD